MCPAEPTTEFSEKDGDFDRLFGADSGRAWFAMSAEYQATPHLYDLSLHYHPIKYTSNLNQIGYTYLNNITQVNIHLYAFTWS